ncbi:HAD family hydrolase [Streptomyces sp. NRRL B-3648]|uniref:HAD family hydrolase n=1 Tax=Streptomyces sp. NRRL B-3648 TaxID=1519493 RepID=UPI0018FE3B87|nr:HAD-IA family hydrolase [Streptomyces sp. NRRL B-3648]
MVTVVGGEEPERRMGDRARQQQGREVDELLKEMAPLPGARDLLVAVKDCGHRLVPASSAQQRHVEVFLDMLDARDIDDDWTTSAYVESAKPAPDLLQVALKKSGAPPDASRVMADDSVWDVEAAKRAGMPAIVVRSRGLPAPSPSMTPPATSRRHRTTPHSPDAPPSPGPPGCGARHRPRGEKHLPSHPQGSTATDDRQ